MALWNRRRALAGLSASTALLLPPSADALGLLDDPA